jgi:RNA polymerase-binding transcription factor DksA
MSLTAIKTTYSQLEIESFKSLILQKKVEAEAQLRYYKDSIKGNPNSTPENRSYTDTALLRKESIGELATRQEKYIIDLKNALLRIQNGVYAVCIETGELISKERLSLVPHATMTVAGKNTRKERLRRIKQ